MKAWFVTGYKDVAGVLASNSQSPDRLSPFYAALPEAQRSTLAEAMRYLNRWVVFRDPPEHTRLRMLMNKVFAAQSIQSLRPEIERITHRLLQDLAQSREADLVAQFTMQLPALVIMSMLGVPHERLQEIKTWSDDIMLLIGSARQTPDKYERARSGAVAMAGLFRELIAQRRSRLGGDALSLLIAARENEDRLSDDELIGTAMLFLFAGHETTTNLIGNATYHLLRHPEARALYISDSSSHATALEEFLRFEGPITSLGRVVCRDHELGGKTLRNGERVFAFIASANRDPSVFDAPDTLDLTRDPNPHLTFGRGIHFCLGATLARLEAQIALPMLFEAYPDLSFGAREPEWVDALVMRGLKSFPVRLH